MSTESEDFAKFAATLVAEIPKAETPAEGTPAPETPKTEAKTEEPKTAETPTPEAKTETPPSKVEEPKKPEEKPTDWAALAAKDKERRAARAAARAREAETAQMLAEAQAKAAQLDEIMKLSKEKRLAALEKLGLTVDDVNTEYIRSIEQDPNKAPPALVKAEKRIADLEAKLDAVLQRDEQAKLEQTKREAEATRTKIETEYTARAAAALKEKPTDYEALSNHPKGSEVVFHYIAAHYAKTATFDDAGNLLAPGEELDVHEACRRAEAALVEENKWTANVSKFRGSAKAPDTTTIAGNARQPEPPKEQAASDDSEFTNTVLRLVKQQAG